MQGAAGCERMWRVAVFTNHFVGGLDGFFSDAPTHVLVKSYAA